MDGVEPKSVVEELLFMSMNETSSIILQFVYAQPFDVNILVFPNNPPVHTFRLV